MTRTNGATPWICLLYHDVSSGPPVASGGPARFAVSAASFATQLKLIRDAGYGGCSLAAAIRGCVGRALALTFDDGEIGQYARAFPALVAHGMTATFFVTTSWVGRPGYISWEQLREMKAAGMSIQSHTRSHPFLSELTAGALLDELRGSKAELDDSLGQDTTTIAFPGGDYPRAALRPLLCDVGYSVVATSRWGVNPTGMHGAAGLTYVRRCTIQGQPAPRYFCRVLAGERWLSARRRSREAVLGGLRRCLGPSRYARWRRRVLDGLAGDHAGA